MTFKLHSRDDNFKWFHFRKDYGSFVESFTVSYLFDGTAVMSGDYGCLAWQRQWFPDTPDYGFPHNGTGIAYFAEKVVRGCVEQQIRTWDLTVAKQAMDDNIVEYREDNNYSYLNAFVEVREIMDEFENGLYGQIQFGEAFMSVEEVVEGENWYDIGECYTDTFIWKHTMLCNVSDVIMEEIENG